MTDISDAADLLATARDVLLKEILSALPSNRRYAALMVANAIAIAEREHRFGADADRNEARRLRALMEICGLPPPQSSNASDPLPSLRKGLCGAIRAGEFDDPGREAALATQLAQVAADRVAISNPKALRNER